jgi:AcrR family transcriptional regulator
VPKATPTAGAPTGPPAGRRYHHGNLRVALVSAGYDLARTGGVSAVVLREVTRRAGVTVRAAYRHFGSRDELLLAVAAPALADLARTIESHLDRVEATDPAERAKECLRAVGEGYIAYALDEPGAFDVAFFGLATMREADDPAAVGRSGRTPYQLLIAALDQLAAAGLTDPARHDLAATYCWSATHGFATLATRGPIRDLPRETLDAMAAELVAATVAGLVRAGGPGPKPPSSGQKVQE